MSAETITLDEPRELATAQGDGAGRNGEADPDVPVLVIEPRSGWRLIDIKELYEFRDLFRFLVWRGIKVLYAQTAIGVGWAVIQPVFSMLVFSVVFGKLAKVGSDGVPYPIFSFAALVPWTYFANAVTEGTNSLVSNSNMISKVYFPRLILPLSAVMAKLVDFSIAMTILFGLITWFHFVPPPVEEIDQEAAATQAITPANSPADSPADAAGNSTYKVAAETGRATESAVIGDAVSEPWTFTFSWGLLALPLLIVLMMATAAGLGMWLTALAIQYRDVKHAMSFVVQLLMYAAPVVYGTSLIPTRYELWQGGVINPQLLYAINPMVGVIEGFRSALLGTRAMPWDFIGIGCLSAAALFVSGALYFRSKERLFADVA